jgi:hypothetical protein
VYTITTPAAMTPVDVSKIIFNPRVTILFIVDTGKMAPIEGAGIAKLYLRLKNVGP